MTISRHLSRSRVAASLAALSCAVLVAGFAAGDPATPGEGTAAADASPGLILLVRHAEAEGTGTGAALTEVGRLRAEALADALADEVLTAVLTTDTRRTRDTAAPVAARHGLELEIYDHRDLAGLAARLRQRGGTLLVVGHSNTTPELVELLGGAPGGPIAHDEHDRLYRIEAATGRTTVERFAGGRESMAPAP